MPVVTLNESAVYAFIADTCILVVIAYLLARGKTLTLLFSDNLSRGQVLLLGFAMGAMGLVEAVFPAAGLPYATHTLFVIFATVIGGLPVGLISAAVVTIGAYLFQAHMLVVPTMLAVLISALLGKLVWRAKTVRARLVAGTLVGSMAQSCRLVLRMLLTAGLPTHQTLYTFWMSVPANGFGVALLLLVVSDAQIRAQSERALALASQAQLNAWKARIHPHFLFNTLNSIAELCDVSPKRAETAILQLSRIMRYSLETRERYAIPLAEEVAIAQAYLGIEQERLGDRLSVVFQCDSTCDNSSVPPYAIQTLVENSINHGVVPKKGPVTVKVTIRACGKNTLVAVQDSGVGLTDSIRQRLSRHENVNAHSMQILNQHLVQSYGPRARLRLFSKQSAGTLIAFRVPKRTQFTL